MRVYAHDTPRDFVNPILLIAGLADLLKKPRSALTKEDRDAEQAALFSYAYAVGKGLATLRVRLGEGPQRDYDVQFKWSIGSIEHLVPVQLKQLPPKTVAPNESLEDLVKKASVRCTGNDLIVAVHANREDHYSTLSFPKRFHIRELCIWGWSKKDLSQLVVTSFEMGAAESLQWFVDFPPPGYRAIRRPNASD